MVVVAVMVCVYNINNYKEGVMNLRGGSNRVTGGVVESEGGENERIQCTDI